MLTSEGFQFPEFAILALAMTLTMMTGGIDLSVVGVANLSAVVAATLLASFASAGISTLESLPWLALAYTAALAVGAGQLELNVMMPLMSFNVLFAIRILGNALDQTRRLCIEGIEANPARCQAYADGSMGLATALNPTIGYANAAKVAKEALRRGVPIPEMVREMEILSDDEMKKVLDPKAMTEPGIPGT